ncbi:unnamed protein product (macronuclear) [Paramecium tetraurelia]|uniref:Transmembrane protein n=1 Tax=Paramecium tetraurelia TaxID=5888 RepID=A0CH24_PARTE|nr:uncharacterized protein GSPATT00007531001 [Paramecium tetraurelia]CAK70091.1 unnamed protein product [Paramecium tetraurelia]|eukprot:XP_001437488.1 hypothetical protein (macronuclear) [Paramecium tetraurelia strain d4-2]
MPPKLSEEPRKTLSSMLSSNCSKTKSDPQPHKPALEENDFHNTNIFNLKNESQIYCYSLVIQKTPHHIYLCFQFGTINYFGINVTLSILQQNHLTIYFEIINASIIHFSLNPIQYYVTVQQQRFKYLIIIALVKDQNISPTLKNLVSYSSIVNMTCDQKLKFNSKCQKNEQQMCIFLNTQFIVKLKTTFKSIKNLNRQF